MSIRRRLCVPPAPKLPSGLVELMDGLARDVLKHNPQDIYEFCAQHMETLLELRDGHAPKSIMTLDQKIVKAQKKVKERAEQRKHAYDEMLLLTTCNVVAGEEILTSSHIPKDGTEFLKTTENKREEIIYNAEKNAQEKENDIISPEFKDSDSKDPAEFAVEDTKQDLEENDKNNQDALEVTLTKDEHKVTSTQESDVTVEKNNTNESSSSNNSLEQNITSNENQSIVTDSAAQSLNENKTLVKSELNDHMEDKSNEAEFKNNLPTDIKIANGTSDELISMITTFNNALDIDDEINKNNKDYKVKDIASAEFMNLPNANEKVLNDETKNSSIEVHTEDVNQEEDNKILAVILSKNVEPDTSYEIKEANFILNNELGKKISEVPVGSENAAKSNDIKTNNSPMDLETAAITIQKVFRSFLFKTKTASYDDPTTVDMHLLNEDKDKDDNDALNKQLKDRRPLGISRMDTVLQTVNEEKSLSLSTDDSSTLSSAATIIQAHVRGFLARNKFNLNKTTSTNSCIDSDAPSIPSLEADSDNRKSKTVLNIHIVPEGGHFISRDESIMTSMDLSLDNSPPSSVNLHPLGYDKSERRKQLKREDAIQSVSPPSNNSGKLSDDVDTVKEVLDEESKKTQELTILEKKTTVTDDSASDTSNTAEGKISNKEQSKIENPVPDLASDEMDVITPFEAIEEKSSHESKNESKLLHSGEFHDIIVPTNVSRCDTSVVRGE